MSNDIKIAITGKLRSGKSTISNHLVTAHGFTPVSFGGALKLYAEKMFKHSNVYKSEPITRPDPFGGVETISYRKPRRLFQDFGQAMRELDPDIWIDHVAERIRLIELEAAAKSEQARIIIDDLRQPNEYEWARASGFVIVRVNANEDTCIDRAKEAGDDFDIDDLRHVTEQYVDDLEVDYEIDNNDIEQTELERRIDDILSELAYDGNGDVFYSVK